MGTGNGAGVPGTAESLKKIGRRAFWEAKQAEKLEQDLGAARAEARENAFREVVQLRGRAIMLLEHYQKYASETEKNNVIEARALTGTANQIEMRDEESPTLPDILDGERCGSEMALDDMLERDERAELARLKAKYNPAPSAAVEETRTASAEQPSSKTDFYEAADKLQRTAWGLHATAEALRDELSEAANGIGPLSKDDTFDRAWRLSEMILAGLEQLSEKAGDLHAASGDLPSEAGRSFSPEKVHVQ